MLWFTKYLWVAVVVVSVAGLWYPLLGYFLPVVFATLMLSSVFRGRWFCGNLCPRGSFNDHVLSKISRNTKIPAAFKSMWVRIPIFAALMAFMFYRVIQTGGVVEKVGMVFVTMCILTTAAAILLGAAYSPRAWCTLCPMGTLQRYLGKGKHEIRVSATCTGCTLCHSVCPMQYEVNTQEKPDCIKCGRCINVCPQNALST